MIKLMDLLEFKLLQKKSMAGEWQTLRVASDSMMPLLQIGQFIEVQKIEIGHLEKFDIIIFFQDGRLICHFLWAIQDQLLITKSLKNPQAVDWPVKPELLLGKANVTIPWQLKLKVWWHNKYD